MPEYHILYSFRQLKVYDNFSIYLKHKKPKIRHCRGFSFTHDFNETVAMDLTQFRNAYILHLINHATILSVGVIINSKRKVVIIDKTFKQYTLLFGKPNYYSCLTMEMNLTMFSEKWVSN